MKKSFRYPLREDSEAGVHSGHTSVRGSVSRCEKRRRASFVSNRVTVTRRVMRARMAC